ncbi:MAG: hypothetical protein JWO03_4046, partial [Bacteroidetes bacterium]|nr:hypothetical protein [Bacteroidota bacterium]
MKRIVASMIIGTLLTVLLSNCSKNNNSSLDGTSANTVSTSENMSGDVNQVVAQAAADNQISGKTAALCATITISPNDTVSFPKTVTLDFGNGCTGPDGVTRKGIMTCVYTGRFHTAGTTVTVTFQNYSVNGNALEGTFVISNTSSAGAMNLSTQVTGGRVTKSDGTSFTWAGTRSLTQTAGNSTPTVLTDDEYTYSGTTTGVNFKSKNFTTTSQDVVLRTGCKYLVSGTT